MRKTCRNCNFCEMFYVNYWYSFFESSVLYCLVDKVPTERTDVCEYWQKKVVRYDVSDERFNQVENDLKAILEILGGADE